MKHLVLTSFFTSLLGCPSGWAQAPADTYQGVPQDAGWSRPDAEALALESHPDATDAEPISPDTVRRFPHLAPFVGNILIGTASLQVVLAGVPALPPGSPWQPAALAFFAAQLGIWQRQEALLGIDLQNVAPAYGADLHPIAVDIGRDPDGAVAYVSFIYGANAAPGPKQLVTWRLDGSLGRLAVYFDQFLGPGSFAAATKAAVAAPYWQLRLRGEAETLFGPSVTLGDLRGTATALRYHGTDLVGILGYRPFNAHANVLIPALLPQKSAQSPPVEGFELLLTKGATAAMLARAQTLQDCLYGVARPRLDLRDEAKVEWTQSCDTVLSLASLRVHLAVSDAAPSIAQPLFIFDAAGRLIHYTAVSGGAGLNVALPPGSGYQLGDTAAGRAVSGVPAFALRAGESKDLTLPPRHVGTLRLKAAPVDPGAVLLSLEPLLGNERDAELLLEPPLLAKLSRHVWLLSKDLLTTKLLAGTYLVSVATGRSGTFCRQRLAILADRETRLECRAAKGSAALGREVAFADLAWPFASGDATMQSTAWSPAVRTALGQALGLAMQPTEATAVGGEAEAKLMPVLTVTSPATDVALRFWPASRGFTERWVQAMQKVPVDPISRFARFVQDEGAPGWSELGCPGPTTSVAEYRSLIQRLHPSAVRLFGCGLTWAGTADEWLDLWASVATEAAAPLLLTSASTFEIPEHGAFLPRLAFETQRDATEPQNSPWGILAQKTYSLSAGATAFLRQLRPSPPNATAKRGAKARSTDSELLLSLAVLPATHAYEVIVFTEKGRLKRATLAADFGGKGLVTVSGLTLGKAKWLRVEVRGVSGHLVAGRGGEAPHQGATDALLAATNFASIAALSQGTKAEESH